MVDPVERETEGRDRPGRHGEVIIMSREHLWNGIPESIGGCALEFEDSLPR